MGSLSLHANIREREKGVKIQSIESRVESKDNLALDPRLWTLDFSLNDAAMQRDWLSQDIGARWAFISIYAIRPEQPLPQVTPR